MSCYDLKGLLGVPGGSHRILMAPKRNIEGIEQHLQLISYTNWKELLKNHIILMFILVKN